MFSLFFIIGYVGLQEATLNLIGPNTHLLQEVRRQLATVKLSLCGATASDATMGPSSRAQEPERKRKTGQKFWRLFEKDLENP